MRGLQGNEALQGLDTYEQMVNVFAENVKAYWRLWGPLGEQIVRGIVAWEDLQHASLQWSRTLMYSLEAWEDLQRANLQWLQWVREVSGAGETSLPK
jgi:hypothetical protein